MPFFESLLYHPSGNVELEVTLQDASANYGEILGSFHFSGRSGQISKIGFEQSDQEKFECELDLVVGATEKEFDVITKVSGAH
jgi:hypothetical protein